MMIRRFIDRRAGLVPLFLGLLLALTCSSAALGQSRVEMVQQRIVKIFGAGGIQNLNAYSSGFMVDKRGYAITVWNHVLDTPDLAVVLHDGRRFAASVVAAEPRLDLAVLKLESGDEQFPAFSLKDARDVEPGTRVLGFSNMFKVATGDEPVTVMHGVVSARTQLSTRRGSFDVAIDSELYVVDAITNNAGSEGGLLTALSGRPVAMIGRQLRNAQTNTWVNYAVPLTELREPVQQMIAGKYTARTASQRDGQRPRYVPEDFGLVMVPDVVQRTPGYVDAVVAGSAAQKAGVQREDLVVYVNDQLVRSCAEFRAALGGVANGRKVELVVRRQDKLVPFSLVAPVKAKGGK